MKLMSYCFKATGAFSWRHTSLIILKPTTSPFPEKSDRYKKKLINKKKILKMVEYKGNLPSILKVAFFGVVSLSFIKVNTENEGKVNLP